MAVFLPTQGARSENTASFRGQVFPQLQPAVHTLHQNRQLWGLLSDEVQALALERLGTVISHTVFINSFCTSQFPRKSVNSFFISVISEDKLKDLCGNRLFQEKV